MGIKQSFCESNKDFIQQLQQLEPFDVIINYSAESSETTLPFAKTFAKIVSPVIPDIHTLKNIQWICLNINTLITKQAPLYSQLLQQTLNALVKGRLRASPLPLLHSEQVAEAFAQCQMQPLALTIGATERLKAQTFKEVETQDFSNGSYLITGGFGGFGLKLAEWLAKNGAKHLVLVGRRGAVSDDAKQSLALLKIAGVDVLEAKVDISDETQVESLIQQIQQDFAALKGVFHTAAVLDDAMLNDLTLERLSYVMQPKAMGAWYLHKHTEELNLAHFVLFSSISSLVGKPGQSNYVAANAFLDQLAYYRRAKGLPAISLNWGVLAEVGMAAQQGVEDRLKRMGIGSFTADEAMQMLEIALNAKQAQLGLMNIDWRAVWNTNSNSVVALRYEHLLDPEWLTTESPLQKLFDELKTRDAEQRQTYMTELLRTWVARIMRLPKDSLDTDVPLNTFGLDSLMAVEIQGVIESESGVSLSVLQVMQDNSTQQLADKVLTQIEAQF